MDIWRELADEGVDKGLLEEMQAFRASHPVPEDCLLYTSGRRAGGLPGPARRGGG